MCTFDGRPRSTPRDAMIGGGSRSLETVKMNLIREQRFGYEGLSRSTDEEAECRLHRLCPLHGHCTTVMTIQVKQVPRKNFELLDSAKRTGGGAVGR